MKSTFTFLFSLSCVVLAAQTPLLNYYGRTGESTSAEHFMLLADGTIQLAGSGRQNGARLPDLYFLLLNQTGVLQDSIRWQEAGSAYVEDLVQAPDGTAILVVHNYEEDRLLSDISLIKLDAAGTEMNRMLIQEEINVRAQHTAMDTSGNFYLAYDKRQQNGASDAEWHLRKLSSDFTMVYDVVILQASSDFSFVRNIVALPDGSLAFASNNDLYLLNASGELIWSKNGVEDYNLVSLSNLAAGPAGQLYIYQEYGVYTLWEIDVSTGNINRELRLDQVPGAFLPDDGIFFQEEELWIMAAENGLAHYQLADDNYTQIGTYHYSLRPGSNRDLIVEVKPETDSTWLVMSRSPTKLLRFWPARGEFETLYEPLDLYIEGFDWAQHLAGNGTNWWLTASNLPNTFNNRFDRYTLAADGTELAAARTYGANGIAINSDVLPLSDGKSVEFRSQLNPLVDNPFSLRFYDAELQLEAELFLPVASDNLLDLILYPLQQLSDNVILAPVAEVDFVDDNPVTYYQVDLTTRELIGSQVFSQEDNEFVYPHHISAVDESSFLITYASNLEQFNIRKVDIQDGIVWRTSLTAPAGSQLPSSVERNSIDLSPVDPLLLYGISYRDFFRFTFLNPATGDSLNSFDSFLAHRSTAANFRADGSLQLAGSNVNPFSTGSDDLYSLYLEHYSLEGDLEETVVHHVPFGFEFTELRRLNNGFFAAYGAAFDREESDAFLVIFNEAGDIMTSTVPIQPAADLLQLMPNPSAGPLQLRLENDYTGPLNIQLYNLQGQRLRTWSDAKQTTAWQWSATLDDLPPATYLIRVQTKQGELAQLWSKQ